MSDLFRQQADAPQPPPMLSLVSSSSRLWLLSSPVSRAVHAAATWMWPRPEHVDLTADSWRDKDMRECRVSRLWSVSPIVRGCTLEVIQNNSDNNAFKAGQWLDLFIPGEEKVGGFSMTSPPSRMMSEGNTSAPQLDLAVKRSDWPPALWIHNRAKVGDVVNIRIGGDFHYPNAVTSAQPEHNVLLIAGGVGINPLYSIFQHLKEEIQSGSFSGRVRTLFSASSADELLFRQEMDIACAGSNENLAVKYFVTRKDVHSSSDRIISERMTSGHVRSSVETLSDRATFCFVCGPPGMIADVIGFLREAGVDDEHVFYEKWW